VTLEAAIRTHPERPVVGVGAVIVRRGEVVLVKRGREPLLGMWSLPGGAVELGESLVDAVAREALEETGLRVEVGPLVEVVDRVHPDADGRIEYHYVVIDYLCRARSGSLLAGSDAADVRWAGAHELAGLQVAEATVAVIKRALNLSWTGRRNPVQHD
jgi:8-oxo-dGTP diphosphatase